MTNDRAVAYINIENLRHNYNVIKSKVKESTKVMAVVKANAYGHDVKIIADELDKCGADMFAVSNISEALELRSVIPHKDILILGFTSFMVTLVLVVTRTDRAAAAANMKTICVQLQTIFRADILKKL